MHGYVHLLLLCAGGGHIVVTLPNMIQDAVTNSLPYIQKRSPTYYFRHELNLPNNDRTKAWLRSILLQESRAALGLTRANPGRAMFMFNIRCWPTVEPR